VLIWDTETSGLPGVSILSVDQQPEIIEFAAIKVDDKTLEIKDSLSFMCKPRILPLSEVITKITGIRDSDLKDKQPFVSHLERVTDFFLGERTMVAHNLPFDKSILLYELRRLDREHNFPWPPVHLCTVELTVDIQGKNSKQEWLYKHYTKVEANQTHRALGDVEQLLTIIGYMRAEGRI